MKMRLFAAAVLGDHCLRGGADVFAFRCVVTITRTLQHGKAPKMRAQLLGNNNGVRSYAVVFGTGDEVLVG